MKEAFILVTAKTMQEFEWAIKTIEESHGHVLHSYPPNVVIATLQPNMASHLVGQPGIASVDLDQITDEKLESAPTEIQMAMMTWNEHLRARKGKASRDGTSRGLSWGDPGRLPPDPPPHIQERLRRRERMMQRPKKPGKKKSPQV